MTSLPALCAPPKIHRIINFHSIMERVAAGAARDYCHCPICEHPFGTDPDANAKSFTDCFKTSLPISKSFADKTSLPIRSRECSHSVCLGCLQNYQLTEAKGRRANRPRVWIKCPVCSEENKFNTKQLIIDRKRCALILHKAHTKKTVIREKKTKDPPAGNMRPHAPQRRGVWLKTGKETTGRAQGEDAPGGMVIRSAIPDLPTWNPTRMSDPQPRLGAKKPRLGAKKRSAMN